MHTVTEEKPLLRYLIENFPGVKRNKAKQILKYGSAEVNGRVITSHSYQLKKGDQLNILEKDVALQKNLKSEMSFLIVYEDQALIVIDKPVRLLTIATDREKIHTAYHELTDYVRLSSMDGKGRIFIVHRIDRETSGLLVFAKNELTKAALQKNWGKVTKKYYAVVEGTPKPPEGSIESYLVEDEFKRVYSISRQTELSKHAVTHYKLIRGNRLYSLLDVLMETGRKNQIRVHLSDIGHPIIGDEKYGSTLNPAKRMGLHAYFLQFDHPETGLRMTFQSELPRDLATVVR